MPFLIWEGIFLTGKVQPLNFNYLWQLKTTNHGNGQKYGHWFCINWVIINLNFLYQ